MRILSQNGRIDLPYEVISVELVGGTTIVAQTYLFGSGADNFATIAEYSIESKARKAMEMLHEAYTGIPLILQNVDISDDVKEMFEKWKKQGICVVSENQPSKVEYVGNILFQFPFDDELQV